MNSDPTPQPAVEPLDRPDWVKPALDEIRQQVADELVIVRRENARLRDALQEIFDGNRCRCGDAWTKRGRHEPECAYESHFTAGVALGLIDPETGKAVQRG